MSRLSFKTAAVFLGPILALATTRANGEPGQLKHYMLASEKLSRPLIHENLRYGCVHWAGWKPDRCEVLFAAFWQALDPKFFRSAGVDGQAAAGLGVAFGEGLKRFFSNPNLPGILDELRRRILEDESFELWSSTEFLSASSDLRLEFLATLFQDTSPSLSVFQLYLQNSWASNVALVKYKSLLRALQNRLALQSPEDGFFPGSAQLKQPVRIPYHFYVPAWTARKLVLGGMAKKDAALMPFLLSLAYEKSKKGLWEIWKGDTRNLDSASLENLYLSYCGIRFSLSTPTSICSSKRLFMKLLGLPLKESLPLLLESL